MAHEFASDFERALRSASKRTLIETILKHVEGTKLETKFSVDVERLNRERSRSPGRGRSPGPPPARPGSYSPTSDIYFHKRVPPRTLSPGNEDRLWRIEKKAHAIRVYPHLVDEHNSRATPVSRHSTAVATDFTSLKDLCARRLGLREDLHRVRLFDADGHELFELADVVTDSDVWVTGGWVYNPHSNDTRTRAARIPKIHDDSPLLVQPRAKIFALKNARTHSPKPIVVSDNILQDATYKLGLPACAKYIYTVDGQRVRPHELEHGQTYYFSTGDEFIDPNSNERAGVDVVLSPRLIKTSTRIWLRRNGTKEPTFRAVLPSSFDQLLTLATNKLDTVRAVTRLFLKGKELYGISELATDDEIDPDNPPFSQPEFDVSPHLLKSPVSVYITANGSTEQDLRLRIALPPLRTQFLSEATSRLGLLRAAKRVFDSEGNEIRGDLSEVERNALLYVSTGEPFRDPTQPPPEPDHDFLISDDSNLLTTPAIMLTCFRNGEDRNHSEPVQICANVTKPIEVFLSECTNKLGFVSAARKVYRLDGSLVKDLNVLANHETVVISCGEGYHGKREEVVVKAKTSKKSGKTRSISDRAPLVHGRSRDSLNSNRKVSGGYPRRGSSTPQRPTNGARHPPKKGRPSGGSPKKVMFSENARHNEARRSSLSKGAPSQPARAATATALPDLPRVSSDTSSQSNSGLNVPAPPVRAVTLDSLPTDERPASDRSRGDSVSSRQSRGSNQRGSSAAQSPVSPNIPNSPHSPLSPVPPISPTRQKSSPRPQPTREPQSPQTNNKPAIPAKSESVASSMGEGEGMKKSVSVTMSF